MTKQKNTSIWNGVFGYVAQARKSGVTADEIVKKTGWSRSTVSSYLTILSNEGYVVKTANRRKISSGRTAAVYVRKQDYVPPAKMTKKAASSKPANKATSRSK